MPLPQITSSHSRRRFIHWALVAGLAFSANPLLTASLGQRSYRIKTGDTLSKIAHKFGVTVGDLKRANGLKSDRILAGKKLIIPSPSSTHALDPVIAATRPLKIKRSRWQYIVAHHSAIEKGNAAIYEANHHRRGMSNGLAYHFVIGNGIDSGDGEIEIGPRWHKQLRGGHVRDSHVNDVGIGICIVGNLENHPPTPKQHASLVMLVDYLKQNCVAPDFEFTVHKWVDGPRHTVCPGKHFPYAEMKRAYCQ